MKFIAWNKRKIWKPKQYEITPHYYHTIYYRCSYGVNYVHEYFVATDSHLQISHQASLKHENFTESYNSYTTLLPQTILQLQLHFSCTLYNINNLQRLVLIGMVGYYYMFLILKCFLIYPNLDEVVSIGSNLIWSVVICRDIYNISRMQIWKKLLKIAQMVPVVLMFEWSCFTYPNMIEAARICPNVCNCM